MAMGINHVAYKLMAFATGALFSGLAGTIFAAKLQSVYPHSMNFLVSINVLCLIIIGGMGSIPGVFVGALVLMGSPELLREFAEYRYLVYGALLVVMMLTRPEGLWPDARRRLELHEEELAAMAKTQAEPRRWNLQGNEEKTRWPFWLQKELQSVSADSKRSARSTWKSRKRQSTALSGRTVPGRPHFSTASQDFIHLKKA